METHPRGGCVFALCRLLTPHALEEKYDPEMRFRPIRANAALIVTALLIILSCFHYYTAGFGLLRETTHRGVHLAFVLGLVFLVFPLRKAMLEHPRPPSATGAGRRAAVRLAPGASRSRSSVLYMPYIFDDLAFRVGNPTHARHRDGQHPRRAAARRHAARDGMAAADHRDRLHGLRAGGVVVPGPAQALGRVVAARSSITCISRARASTASRSAWSRRTSSTSCCSACSPPRIGLGQLFIDIASSIAGRYAGGPAKVSVFASAMFGMLSGSSVANAVTVGSLTIPAMVRLGYPRHFAGGVEAASSTGGQITPPIMGAAAFLMIEFLNLPYSTIIIAAIVPAFMHFFGVFMQVHFEAKNKGLRGLTKEELPDLPKTLAANWPTLIPLFLLVGIIVNGNTPYLAAFTGISSCILVGLFTSRKGTTLAQYAALAGLARGADRDHHASFGGFERLGVPRDARRRCRWCIARSGASRASAARADPRRVRGRREVRARRGRGRRDRGHRHRRGDAHRRRLQAVVHRDVRRADDRVRRRWRCCPAGWADMRVADARRRAHHDRPRVHPDGLRHSDDRQLHHHGDGGGADARAARRAAHRRALLRLLLRRAGGHHAAGRARGVCGGGHGGIGSVQDGQHRVPAGPRQGAGAVRVRVRAVAAHHGATTSRGTSSGSRSSAASWASRCFRRRFRTSC